MWNKSDSIRVSRLSGRCEKLINLTVYLLKNKAGDILEFCYYQQILWKDRK